MADTTELYPAHMWEIFGVGNHLSDDCLMLSEEVHRARDSFMAQLSSVLSRGIRHVIAPPSAVWRHDNINPHDTAKPMAHKVRGLGGPGMREKVGVQGLLSVLSQGIRHVIAPPRAVRRHDDVNPHDTATSMAHKVSVLALIGDVLVIGTVAIIKGRGGRGNPGGCGGTMM